MRVYVLSRTLSTVAMLCLCAGSAQATENQSPEDGARTIRVASNGDDTSPCGDRGDPCRSISHGIFNAVPGDTVLVGPGRYGDLNGDGSLGGVGEETGDFSNSAILHVDTAVRIISTHGAAVTVIDASQMSSGAIPVVITAPHAQFGAHGRGFTLKAQPNFFALVALSATDATVAGNIGTNAATAFFSEGEGIVLKHNFAYGNIVGYEIRGAGKVLRNAASGNVLGFTVYETGATLRGNTASANDHTGFAIAPSGNGITLIGNLATGNRTAGFRVDRGGSALIIRNNIFGQFCGILNDSGTRIVATHNYWGAASGPGPDPADPVCNLDITSDTVAIPYSPSPIRVPRPF